jgi:hypothetical protein
MSSLELKAYEIFKTKPGETEAATILEWVEEKSDKKIAEQKDVLATKQDISEAKVEIMRWMFGVFVVLMLAIVGLYFKH